MEWSHKTVPSCGSWWCWFCLGHTRAGQNFEKWKNEKFEKRKIFSFSKNAENFFCAPDCRDLCFCLSWQFLFLSWQCLFVLIAYFKSSVLNTGRKICPKKVFIDKKYISLLYLITYSPFADLYCWFITSWEFIIQFKKFLLTVVEKIDFLFRLKFKNFVCHIERHQNQD